MYPNFCVKPTALPPPAAFNGPPSRPIRKPTGWSPAIRLFRIWRISLLLIATALFILPHPVPAISSPWIDATSQSGLDGYSGTRVKFADLNGDHRPDAVLLRDNGKTETPLLFLNAPAAGSAPRFRPVTDVGLPDISERDVLVFADLDNDGRQDAILGRNLDIYQPDYQPPSEGPLLTSWHPGLGDGRFGPPVEIEQATLATTAAIAVGDANLDGLPDLWIGNWYQRYFTGYEAFDNDLLLQYRSTNYAPRFQRWPLPHESSPTDYRTDLNGRPTYGAAIVRLDDGLPYLLELHYGRRWNRLYRLSHRQRLLKPDSDASDLPSQPFELQEPRAAGQHVVRRLRGMEIAAQAGIDGDDIRHGRHPVWPAELTRSRPRAARPDEPPFRANGNTFDAAVGDIDNDGDFDLFFSTIIHMWAGDSSDRSRFLVSQLKESGTLRFTSPPHLSVDRLPKPSGPGEPLEPKHTTEQNQGDIYAELADLNHDGRLDLLLCSSDYPDAPPYDERLRIFFQQADGSFHDATHSLGLDHIGAGMPSLADVDQDGDLDLLIGQSFNRLPRHLRRQAALTSGALRPDSPSDANPERRIRLFLNRASEERPSFILQLEGDPQQGTTRAAFGAIVLLTADLDGDPHTPSETQIRQVLGPAGHSGKQSSLDLHWGLGAATEVERLEIRWPGDDGQPRAPLVFHDLPAGRYTLDQTSGQLATP